ncbi:MAG: SDR family oxidoreductase [Ignavibacteriaceae bacterium]|nr:SDR family oxidoreductase [Ignavibacteriaceae bacterium]
MSKQILVIGATGRVGSELVRLLIENGESVSAATRNPVTNASKFFNTVDVVEFDYDRPETFAPALNGVEKIFLSVRPGDNHSDIVSMPLIELAKQMNVQHIVDLTAMGVEQDESFMLRKLEKNVEASGVEFTHLRPNWFMQNFNSGPMYTEIMATKELHLPAADAEISFVDVRDIAAVAFTALTHFGHSGKAYTLTGQESLSHFQVVDIISQVIFDKISYVPVTEEAARETMINRKIPHDLIERWTDFYRKVRAGLCSTISPDIESVLGRPPILFDRYAGDYAASWQ